MSAANAADRHETLTDIVVDKLSMFHVVSDVHDVTHHGERDTPSGGALSTQWWTAPAPQLLSLHSCE